MKNFSIRSARLSDLDSIMEIIEDAVTLLKNASVDQWQHHYPNHEVIQHDIMNETMFVAIEADLVVGCACISPLADENYEVILNGQWLTDSTYMVIHRIAVRKSYYGLGIARLLINFAEKIALENRIDSIRVDTHMQNIPMNQLLNQCGYQKCGTIILKNSRGGDPLRIAYEKVIRI